jgi:hypothetical protein
LLRAIPAQREVRLNVTTRHVAPASASAPAFVELYERARTILDARIDALRCDDVTATARSWVVAQAWFVNQFGARSLYSASITSAVSFLDEGAPSSVGEPRPDAAALLVPSGGTVEAFAAKHLDESGSRRLDEINIDFEHAEPARDITVSYGEYVETCEGLDYAPIVERAEMRARFHYQTLRACDGVSVSPFDILRREWSCLSTGKAVDPTIATVHLFFRI